MHSEDSNNHECGEFFLGESYGALKWAFDQEIHSSSQKFVLVALAYHVYRHTGNAFPSVETISRETGLDRKTVIQALDKNVAANLIIDTGKRDGKTGRVKVYNFHHLKAPKTEPLENKTIPDSEPLNGKIVEQQSSNGGAIVAQQSQKRDTEPGTGNREPGTKKGRTSPAELVVRENELKSVQEKIRALKKTHFEAWTTEKRQTANRLRDRELQLLEILGMSADIAVDA